MQTIMTISEEAETATKGFIGYARDEQGIKILAPKVGSTVHFYGASLGVKNAVAIFKEVISRLSGASTRTQAEPPMHRSAKGSHTIYRVKANRPHSAKTAGGQIRKGGECIDSCSILR